MYSRDIHHHYPSGSRRFQAPTPQYSSSQFSTHYIPSGTLTPQAPLTVQNPSTAVQPLSSTRGHASAIAQPALSLRRDAMSRLQQDSVYYPASGTRPPGDAAHTRRRSTSTSGHRLNPVANSSNVDHLIDSFSQCRISQAHGPSSSSYYPTSRSHHPSSSIAPQQPASTYPELLPQAVHDGEAWMKYASFQRGEGGVFWMCTACSHGPPSGIKSVVKRHIEGEHLSYRPYVCDDCGKTFAQKQQLEVHRNVHTRNEPYSCKYCDTKFRDPAKRTRHMQERHAHQSRTAISTDTPPVMWNTNAAAGSSSSQPTTYANVPTWNLYSSRQMPGYENIFPWSAKS